jgi:hypothetical protein
MACAAIALVMVLPPLALITVRAPVAAVVGLTALALLPVLVLLKGRNRALAVETTTWLLSAYLAVLLWMTPRLW